MHRDADGKNDKKPGDECEYGGGAEARVGGGCGAPGFGDGVPVPKDGQEERLLGRGRVRRLLYMEITRGGGPNQESEEVES